MTASTCCARAFLLDQLKNTKESRPVTANQSGWSARRNAVATNDSMVLGGDITEGDPRQQGRAGEMGVTVRASCSWVMSTMEVLRLS